MGCCKLLQVLGYWPRQTSSVQHNHGQIHDSSCQKCDMSQNGQEFCKEDARDMGVVLTLQLSVRGTVVGQNPELQNGLCGQYSKTLDSV